MQTATLSKQSAFNPSVEPRTLTQYNLPIGYLRAFVTVLVLAFHSVMAYSPDAPPPSRSLLSRPLWWTAFPVVDSHTWSGFRLFIGFNDIFFMSLMFFLSGIFVWSSLKRKGASGFLRGRALRLGVPFLFAAAVLAPLAYYPSYLQIAGSHSVGNYLYEWFSLGEWPAGPAWFVWVLLVFDCLAAGLFLLIPKASGVLAKMSSNAERRPGRFFALVLIASALAYIPMALAFNPLSWTVFGPFYFQTSRILNYAVYFFAGISIGAFGIDRGLLAQAGKLARRWWLWAFAALGAFFIAIIGTVIAMANYARAPHTSVFVGSCGFVLSCAASCFALIALFVRFTRVPNRIFDVLRDNAYGMYLIHYVFVSWVQYSLLHLMWPGFMKGVAASIAVLVLSVATTAALRRVRTIGRVI